METNTLEPRDIDICSELVFALSNSHIPHVMLLGILHVSASWKQSRYVLRYPCVWAPMGAFMYMVTLDSHRDLQSGYWYFQVPGEYVTTESSIHLLKVTLTVRGLACSLHLAETLNYDHHTWLWLVDGQTFRHLGHNPIGASLPWSLASESTVLVTQQNQPGRDQIFRWIQLLLAHPSADVTYQDGTLNRKVFKLLPDKS